jgi:hypothetical protein
MASGSENKVRIVIDVEGEAGQKTLEKIATATAKVGESSRLASHGLGLLSSASKGAVGVLDSLWTKIWGLAGTYGLYRLAESFIDAAAAEETFIRQMNFALEPMNRFSKQGEKMDEWLDNLSIRGLRMFKGDELQQAAIDLENFGISARENLELLGDVAAQMGKPIGAVVNMLQQFSMGNYKGLKQFGIDIEDLMSRVGSWTRVGFFSSSTTTVTEWDALMDILKEKFQGAAASAENDWKSMITALWNYWGLFMEKIMGSGPFESMKEKVKIFLDWLESPEGTSAFERWAKSIGEWLDTAIKDVWDFGSRVVSYLKLIFSSENPWEMLWADMYGTVVKVFNWMLDYFRTKTAEWIELGKQIGTGIYEGIAAQLAQLLPGLWQRALGLAGGAPPGLMPLLEQQSGGMVPEVLPPSDYGGYPQNVSLNLGGVSISGVSGGGEEFAGAFDSALADLIRHDRSQVRRALRESGL